MRSNITTHIVVDLDQIRENFQIVKRYVAPAQVMAVLKGNAYGHGAVSAAWVLEQAGCLKCAVATLDEALELRSAGVGMDIHLLGGLTVGQLQTVVRSDLIPFVPDLGRLFEIDRIARRLGKVQRVHIKLDTGMGRLGFLPWQVPDLCEALRRVGNVEVEGVGTHLARAGTDPDFSRIQFARFAECAEMLEEALGKPLVKHVLASAGIALYPDMVLDLVRPGSLIYGLSHVPLPPELPVRPAMSLKSAVVQVKEVPAGWNVGYGDSVADRNMKVALVPAGRVDGYLSASAGRVDVLIRGKFCRVLSIAADQSIVDVSALDQVEVGDEVVIFGTQGESTLLVRTLGVASGSNYGDVIMKISGRVPRIYREGGKEIGEVSLLRRNPEVCVEGRCYEADGSEERYGPAPDGGNAGGDGVS